MKQYQLGPNGGIVTTLNLFSTKFGQVVDLVKKAGKDHKYCIIDTPGKVGGNRNKNKSLDCIFLNAQVKSRCSHGLRQAQ